MFALPCLLFVHRALLSPRTLSTVTNTFFVLLRTDFDLKYFWEWTDFLSYVECMAVFAALTGLVMYLFIDVPVVVETYGLVALITESLLASPQFIRNLKTKSTEGMR